MASRPTGNERRSARNKLGLPGQSPVDSQNAEVLPKNAASLSSKAMQIGTVGGTIVRATHPGIVSKITKANRQFTVEVVASKNALNAEIIAEAPFTRYSQLGTVDVVRGQAVEAGSQLGTVSFLRNGGQTALQYQLFRNGTGTSASEVAPNSAAGAALLRQTNPDGQHVEPEIIFREQPPEASDNDEGLAPPPQAAFTLESIPATSNRFPYVSNPQVRFVEQQNQVFTHDFLVFINGVDVTKFVVGSVRVSLVDKDGWNEVNLKLNNATDNFVITLDNLGVGQDLTARFRNVDIPAEDKYSERAKREIIEYKNDPRRNPFVDIANMQLIQAGSAQGVNIGSNNGVNVLGGGTDQNIGVSSSRDIGGDGAPEDSPGTRRIDRRWQLGFQSTVFHKNDPIRIFRKNPIREANEWMPAFTGYLESTSYSTNYTTGYSEITLKGYDIRALIAKMRVQTTAVTGVTNPRAIFRGRSNESDSIFSDLLEPTILGNPLSGKRFEDVMEFLITGSSSADPDLTRRFGRSNFQRGIGDFQLGDKILYNPGDSSNGQSPDPLEHWHALCLFGMDGRTVRRVNGIGLNARPVLKRLTNTGKELAAEFNRRWLTEAEARFIGSETTHDGAWAPHKQFVHFLLPAEGTGAKNLLDFDAFNANSNKLDFRSRLDIMQDFANRIDYQFWVTPVGDIVVEFPMYDFFPRDFQEYKTVFRIDKHLNSDNIQDEAGDMVTAIIANGAIASIRDGNQPAEQFQPKAIVVSPMMMMRYGVIEHDLTLPFIATSDSLARLAQIEFQKKLAESNKMDMDFDYRPFITPNRPVENMERKRMGLTSAVRNDVELFRAGDTSITLRYIRRQIFRQDGTASYTFIFGGESMPITYREIFEPGTTASIGSNITGGGGDQLTIQVNDATGGFSGIQTGATQGTTQAGRVGLLTPTANVASPVVTPSNAQTVSMVQEMGGAPGSPTPSSEQRGRFVAIAQQLSGFNPSFRDQTSGRFGIFGLLPDVRKGLGIGDSIDVTTQIAAADKYFRGLVQKYKGDLDMAVREFALGVNNLRNVDLVQEFKDGFEAINKELGEAYEEISQPLREAFSTLFPGETESSDTSDAASDQAKEAMSAAEEEGAVPAGAGFRTTSGILVFDNREDLATRLRSSSAVEEQAQTNFGNSGV